MYDVELMVVVVSPEVPSSALPSGSWSEPFWRGSEEERTFFCLQLESGLSLVLNESDPRSVGMRSPSSEEQVALEKFGLTHGTYRCWSMWEGLHLIDKKVVETDTEKLQREIEKLREELNTVRKDFEQSRTRHLDDIMKIGEALISEAEERSWCGEYDTFVDDLNRDLFHVLPLRERSYLVTMLVTVEVPLTVDARDEHEAYENARQSLDDYDLSNGEQVDVDLHSVEEA